MKSFFDWKQDRFLESILSSSDTPGHRIIAGYQLWVTEKGKKYILVAFAKDQAELSTEETKKLLIKRVRDDWVKEPPWEQLGWLVEQLAVSGGELEITVVSEGSFGGPGGPLG